MTTIGTRSVSKNSDELESKQRLLDEENIHFDMSPTSMSLSVGMQSFGAKSI